MTYIRLAASVWTVVYFSFVLKSYSRTFLTVHFVCFVVLFMIHNVVQFGIILCMSFESFGELHFRPTFDAGAVRRCIAIVRAIQADCLARVSVNVRLSVSVRSCGGPGVFILVEASWRLPSFHTLGSLTSFSGGPVASANYIT